MYCEFIFYELLRERKTLAGCCWLLIIAHCQNERWTGLLTICFALTRISYGWYMLYHQQGAKKAVILMIFD